VSTTARDTTSRDVAPVGMSDRGSRATPSNVQNLTATGDAVQWRSTAPQVDVRDQEWGLGCPPRACFPRPAARRAA
jgi:hypothetical protein